MRHWQWPSTLDLTHNLKQITFFDFVGRNQIEILAQEKLQHFKSSIHPNIPIIPIIAWFGATLRRVFKLMLLTVTVGAVVFSPSKFLTQNISRENAIFLGIYFGSLTNLKIHVSPEEANYLSDVDGEIIIPDDAILNTTYFMSMYGSGMYLGKRSIDCDPNLDHRLLGNSLIRVSNRSRT